MHGRLLQLVTILSLATSTFTESTACVLACDLTLSKIVFQDIPEDLPYYEKQCSSLLRTTSLYVCSREYCPPGTVEPGLNELNASCARYGGTNLPPFSLVSNVTSDDVKRFRLVDRSEYPTAMRLNISAIPSKALLEDGVRTKVSVMTDLCIDSRHFSLLGHRMHTTSKWKPAFCMRKCPMYPDVASKQLTPPQCCPVRVLACGRRFRPRFPLQSLPIEKFQARPQTNQTQPILLQPSTRDE